MERSSSELGKATAGHFGLYPARFGRLDRVVNNVGAGLFSVFESTPVDTIRALSDTNVFGMTQVRRSALPILAAHGGGHPIAISSCAGIVPAPRGSRTRGLGQARRARSRGRPTFRPAPPRARRPPPRISGSPWRSPHRARATSATVG
ncbi:hypothetical protein GCM10027445_00300 [Amycolatopsis endophytica]|uniref:SDR family NAD(P)-dependent oxidoreductase n=1 Tax=Amycolatopsis endophytica TaxID=860233 RepID=UPI0015C92259